tara:strand:+ start:349 stop:519 length:171 start_codon:yes stop_codon:yes gene_type:complete
MDELMNMIVSDESPSQVTDKIKDILFAKSGERIEMIKPIIAGDMFDDGQEYSSEEE